MRPMNRRRFLNLLAAAPAAAAVTPVLSRAADCTAPHPFTPPRDDFQGQCPVCGMVRPMWARTWITFAPLEGVSQVCSFHCLADWVEKTGAEPTGVMLAVYHAPETAVPAEKAFVVMGSAAAGTMSPVSKVVFADMTEARAFAETCGGEVVGYAVALKTARAAVKGENEKIHAMRLQKGKVVEPAESDACPVCNMVPARYPYGKCQIQSRDGQTLHFCSTQCLFAYLGRPALYVDPPVAPFLVWVVDRGTGMWIGGRAAFYVVGAAKVFGPMGYEAFPFGALAEAGAFAAENGGQALTFDAVTVEKIVPGWTYPGTPAN